MPAYRSPAETEIREAVVARLREIRPQSRIIHEINAVNMTAGRPTRIDVLAVGLEDMVAVEIKSERDKLDRLPDQMEGMRSVAHHAIAVLHERFLEEAETNVHAAHEERDGRFYFRRVPETVARQCGYRVWVHPQRVRVIKPDGIDGLARWDVEPVHGCTSLPEAALDMLWREELAAMAELLLGGVGHRATRPELVRSLRWQCSGKELTRGICRALRARQCVEADPPVDFTGAAIQAPRDDIAPVAGLFDDGRAA